MSGRTQVLPPLIISIPTRDSPVWSLPQDELPYPRVICHFRVPAELTVCTVVPNTQHSEQWLHDMHETAAGSRISCSRSLLATRPLDGWLSMAAAAACFPGLLGVSQSGQTGTETFFRLATEVKVSCGTGVRELVEEAVGLTRACVVCSNETLH